jgi:hypothetical protein
MFYSLSTTVERHCLYFIDYLQLLSRHCRHFIDYLQPLSGHCRHFIDYFQRVVKRTLKANNIRTLRRVMTLIEFLYLSLFANTTGHKAKVSIHKTCKNKDDNPCLRPVAYRQTAQRSSGKKTA